MEKYNLYQELSAKIDDIVKNMSSEDLDNFVQQEIEKTNRQIFFEDQYGPV